MAKDTVTVWVMPHDDPEVGWIINSRSDMKSNFDEMLDEGGDESLIEIKLPWRDDPFYLSLSTVFEKCDPVTYGIEFDRYCDSWTELEMPLDLFIDGDEAAQNLWVEERVNGPASGGATCR